MSVTRRGMVVLPSCAAALEYVFVCWCAYIPHVCGVARMRMSSSRHALLFFSGMIPGVLVFMPPPLFLSFCRCCLHRKLITFVLVGLLASFLGHAASCPVYLQRDTGWRGVCCRNPAAVVPYDIRHRAACLLPITLQPQTHLRAIFAPPPPPPPSCPLLPLSTVWCWRTTQRPTPTPAAVWSC